MCQSDFSKAQGTSGLSRSKHLCRRSAGSLGEGSGHFAQTEIGTAEIQLNFGLQDFQAEPAQIIAAGIERRDSGYNAADLCH